MAYPGYGSAMEMSFGEQALMYPVQSMAGGSDQPIDDVAQRAKAGDTSAFETLVRRHQRVVYGLCIRLLRSEADASEVAQESFLRAYQNLHRYDLGRPFEVWLLAIARNLSLDVLRRRSKFTSDDIDNHIAVLPALDGNAEERAIVRQTHGSLEGALELLPVGDREVLSLYYVQRRSTQEIATILGVARGTIMAKLFRAREKLRLKLKEVEGVVTRRDDLVVVPVREGQS